jgi:hypothetical protein
MDAMKFGQWLAERRRACGYSSQRALIDAVRQHPQLSTSGISEAFLARLEAGVLAHPFRGRVRARVLALSHLLCSTPRELRLFLRQAELTDLSATESEHVERFRAQLSALSTRAHVVLPARPARVVGRAAELDAVLATLAELESGCCAITGMPGVGKTVLAAEALHRLTADAYELARLFPDGVVTVSGTGRRGLPGLVAVLEDVCAYISQQATATAGTPHGRGPEAGLHQPDVRGNTASAADVATAVNRTRLLLADKSLLLLLDNLEADFPLRLALEAILPQITAEADSPHPASLHGRRVVLVTGQYVPDAAILAAHLPLAPLAPEAAHALFQALLGVTLTLSAEERTSCERICAALGYLPLALEIAAAAVTQEKIPLPVLATHVVAHPLDLSRDGMRELRDELARAFAYVDDSARERLAHIASLCASSISLDQAAALNRERPSGATRGPEERAETTPLRATPAEAAPDDPYDVRFAERIAGVAADLGQLVRHSLLGSVASRIPDSGREEPRYTIHPLVKAYAREYLVPNLAREARDRVAHNAQEYALDYLEDHAHDSIRLATHQDFLLAVLRNARGRAQPAQVLRLVSGLTASQSYLLRLGERGMRILRWGIQAAQELGDYQTVVKLLARQGVASYYRGTLQQAHRALFASLVLADTLPESGLRCIPLYDLAIISSNRGDDEASAHYADMLFERGQAADDERMMMTARSLQARFARMRGDVEQARTYLDPCLQWAAHHHDGAGPGLLNESKLRYELACIEGDYARTRQMMEEFVAPYARIGESVWVVEDLLDQAYYAAQVGVLDDALALAARAQREARHTNAPTLIRETAEVLENMRQRNLPRQLAI